MNMALAQNAQTLQAAFQTRLESAPQGRAISWFTPGEPVSWLSFEEFCQRGAEYSAAMSSRGLGKGDVCVIVEVDPEFASSALLGALMLGAIPLLVAPPTIQGTNSVLSDVVRDVVDRANATLVVASTDLLPMREELAGKGNATWVFGVDELAPQAGASIQIVQTEPEATPAYQLTSGTTGFPRICVWKQENVMAALKGMHKAMNLAEDDSCLNWTPLYHDMGLVNNFFLCMSYGIPFCLQSPLDFVRKPAIWLQGLQEAQSTFTWSPNFGFALAAQRIRDREVEDVRLDHVRGFWNAAERIHAETIYKFLDRFSDLGVTRSRLNTNFGCVENVGGATFSDPNVGFVVERLDSRRLHGEQTAIVVPDGESEETPSVEVVSAGRPHPDMDILIVDEKGEPLSDGQVGEVVLLTPSRVIEILGDPDSTADTIRGEHVHTGDLGYRRGPEFFWVGRLREKINLRGKKFDPSDFERILLDLPDLRKGCFAAFGVDNTAEGTQELIILSEVVDSTDRSFDEICGDIRAAVIKQLGVKVKEILLMPVGELTKTSSGKRRHRFFRECYLADDLNPVHRSKGAGLRKK
jgi:fatty-acyl-CoA synthase